MQRTRYCGDTWTKPNQCAQQLFEALFTASPVVVRSCAVRLQEGCEAPTATGPHMLGLQLHLPGSYRRVVQDGDLQHSMFRAVRVVHG